MKFLVFVALFELCTAYAQTPAKSQDLAGAYEVMPGRNAIEQEIHWAFRQLPDFLKACSYSKECHLSPTQARLLQALTVQLSVKTELKFVTQKEGGFVSDQGETERLAITARKPGSTIYINQDLYSRNGQSLGLAFWMGLLAHELIHHLGIEDGSDRVPDQFGVQITQAVTAHLQRVALPVDSEDIQFFYLNLPIPNVLDFFKDFPKGEYFRSYVVDAKGLIGDASMSSLDRFIPYCPNEQFFMTQVFPENASLNALAGQPNKFTAQISFGSLTGCYNQARNNLHRQDLYYLHSVGVKYVNDRYELDLESDFNWRESDSSDGVGVSIKSDIISSEIPSVVKAGSKLIIQAQLKADPKYTIVGCAGWLTSPSWPIANQQTPFRISGDDCRIQTTPVPGQYAIYFERLISDQVPTQDLELQYLCLEINDVTGDCIPGFPAKKTMIRIENKKQVVVAAATGIHFEGVTNAPANAYQVKYQFDRRKGFQFIFDLSNTTAFERIMAVIDGEEADGNGFTFMAPLMQRDYSYLPAKRTPYNPIFPSLQFLPTPQGVKVIAQMQYPAEAAGFRPVWGRLMGLYITTTDLQSIYVDLTSEDLSFMAGGN
jgi:hypothetical protein